MQIMRPGHRYVLDNFDNHLGTGQTLQFIEKEPDPHGGNELVLINDGTTNEEALRMLIDRMNFLQAKHPCRENAIVITKLEESLMWLDKRTAPSEYSDDDPKPRKLEIHDGLTEKERLWREMRNQE